MWQDCCILYSTIAEVCIMFMWQDCCILYSTIADICIIVIIYYVERILVSWYNLSPIQLLKHLEMTDVEWNVMYQMVNIRSNVKYILVET